MPAEPAESSMRTAGDPSGHGAPGLGAALISGRVAWLAAMALLTGALASWNFARMWDDSANYLAMAHGSGVLMPWAGRILLPWLVRELARVHGIGIETGFAAITCVSFLCWLVLTGQRWPARIWTAPFLILPLIVASLQSVYIVDMFHMALTAVFFALLASNVFAAAAFMTVMTLARESSMIFAFVACGVLLFRGRLAGAAAMLGGWLVGAIIVHHASAGAQNIHRMPEMLYLVSKVPLNFVRNWLGMLVWTNGYSWCGDPFATVTLPGHAHLGAITRVGLCAPSAGVPLTTLSCYLTVFGVLPAVLAVKLRARDAVHEVWRQDWWATALLSGAILIVMGPLAGAPVDRTIGFGWPLFLIALPAIWRDGPDWRLAALQTGAAWSPLLLSHVLPAGPAGLSFIGVSEAASVAGLALVIGAAANWAAYRIMMPAPHAVPLRDRASPVSPVKS